MTWTLTKAPPPEIHGVEAGISEYVLGNDIFLEHSTFTRILYPDWKRGFIFELLPIV